MPKLMKKEQAALNYFISELKTAKGPDAAITFGYLVDRWNKVAAIKIDDINGKRIIRYIRDNGLIKKLMADRYGYFIADSRDDYDNYLAMLKRRINQLSKTYNALKRQHT